MIFGRAAIMTLEHGFTKRRRSKVVRIICFSPGRCKFESSDKTLTNWDMA
jgi:hypothetical protein